MGGAAGSSWSAGPLEPELAPGAVHVWRAELAAVEGSPAARTELAAGEGPPELDDLRDVLSEPEQARAGRLVDERRRRMWMRSRGILRLLLGSYLRLDPRAVPIAHGAHGKPVLDAGMLGERPPALSFNLAHSGAVALYALCPDGAVGIDVELARERPLDEVAIAARALGREQARRLQAIADPRARHEQFLVAWTRHEAALKCAGTGLGGADGEHGGAGASDGAGASGVLAPPPPALWRSDIDVGPGAAAALACERPPTQLRCWRWSDRLSWGGAPQ